MSLVAEAERVEDIPENCGVLVICDRNGDTRIVWDRNNSDEVENARRTFNELVSQKRFSAFAVTSGEGKGEQVRHFDPNAEKLILAPPLVGG